MSQPKFELGQVVTYARPTLITPPGEYEVRRIFPDDGIDRNYSIKSSREPYERVARGRDLALLGGERRLAPRRATHGRVESRR